MRKLFMRTSAIILMLCVSLELLLTGAYADNRLVMYSPGREAAESVILPISSESSNEAATNAEESMHSIEAAGSIVNGSPFADRAEAFHESAQVSDRGRLAQAFDSRGNLTPPYPSGEGAVLVSLSKLCYANGILTVEGTAAELEPGVHLWLSVFNADGRMLQATDATDIIGENGNFVWSIPVSITEQEDYTVKAFVLDQGFVPKCPYASRTMRYMSSTEILGSLEVIDDLVVDPTPSSYSNTEVLLGTAFIDDVETINSQSLRVDWENVPGTDYYLIWRKNIQTGQGIFLNESVDGEENSYLDTGLAPVTSYVYIVFAYAQNEEPSTIYISLSSSAFVGETGEEVFAELATPSINEIDIRSTTTLTIQWSAVDNAEGYIVYRAEAQDGAYSEIARYEYPAQNHIDGNLTTNKTYYYMVQAFAYSDAGRFYTGEMSDAMSGTPCLDNPMTGVPAITSVETLDCTHVKILWTGIDGADGFYLYRKKMSTGEIYSIHISNQNTLSYVDAGLCSGTTYSYTIQAYADALVTDTTYYTEESSALSATTIEEEVIVLSRPSIEDITVLSGNTSVTIEWTSVPNAIGYYLLRQVGSNSYEIVQTVNGRTTTTDTKLIPGTKYFYRVQAYAVGSAGTVYTSDRSSAFAVTLPETIEAPTVYVIACGPNSISITWNEISNAQDYLVYRSYNKSSGFSKIAETQDPFYIDSNVEVNVQAFYKVKARTANGTISAYSNLDSDYIDPDDYAEEIDAPDVLSVTTVSSTSLRVKWQLIENAVRYHVYRSSQSGSKGFEKVGETAERTFTDTNLTPNTKYWYRIRAISQSGTESVLGVTDYGTTSTGSGADPGESEVNVSSVSVSPSALELEVGESRWLYVDVRPSNASNTNVVWTSNNTTVATVTSEGMVHAVGNGVAVVTAAARDGSGKEGSCLVTVSTVSAPVEAVPSVIGYAIDPSVVAEGDSFALKGLLCGNGATINKVTIAAFPVGQHSLQGVHVFTETVNSETYDFENVPPIMTGHLYTDSDGRSMSLEAGTNYDIVVYASLSNGEYFRDNTNPSAVVTVTASEEEPFVRVFGVDNTDLEGRTLNFPYNAFSGKTVYVLTNIDIMPSSSDENNISMRCIHVSYTSDGTMYEFTIDGTENPYAYARTVTFKFYENGKVGETVYAAFNVKQAGNPNVPVIGQPTISDGTNTYTPAQPIYLIVGDHNYQNGWTLNVPQISGPDCEWTVYTDDSSIARVYKDSGKVYVHAKATGKTSLYISDIYREDINDVPKSSLHKVCDVKVSEHRYRALLFGTMTHCYNEDGEDAGATAVQALRNQFIANKYSYSHFEIQVCYSGRRDSLFSMISDFVSTGRESDVTYVFSMSHGYNSGISIWNGGYSWNSDGTLADYEYENVTYDALFEALAEIPGKVVFISGACLSGQCIKYAEKYGSNEKFTIMTATNEYYYSRTSHDLYQYTGYYLANVMFVDALIAASDYGDANQDGIVTVDEAFIYAKSFMVDLIERIRNDEVRPPYAKNVEKRGDGTLYEFLYMIDMTQWRVYAMNEFPHDSDPQLYGNADGLALPLFGGNIG